MESEKDEIDTEMDLSGWWRTECVEPFFIGLAGTTNTTEVTDEFEGGEWVLGPS
jgi:hypothetical protein